MEEAGCEDSFDTCQAVAANTTGLDEQAQRVSSSGRFEGR